jgi:hypothetical protein
MIACGSCRPYEDKGREDNLVFNSWLAWTHITVFVDGTGATCASEYALTLKREKRELAVEPHLSSPL